MGAGQAVSAIAPPGGVVVTVKNAGDPAPLVDLTSVRTVGQVSVERATQTTGAYVDGYSPGGTITSSGTITRTANDPLSWSRSMQRTNQLTVADGSAVATLDYDQWVELVSAPG